VDRAGLIPKWVQVHPRKSTNIGEPKYIFINELICFVRSFEVTILHISESFEHKKIKDSISVKLREWFGVSVKEYPSSGHELDIFAVTPDGISIYVEIIWSDTSTNFFRDMSIILEEDEMKAVIRGEKFGLEALSGGERTLLNLLVRIALIKELSRSDILILDHPWALLDHERVTRVISLTKVLKSDFSQLLITTQKEDYSINPDNKIVLTT